MKVIDSFLNCVKNYMNNLDRIKLFWGNETGTKKYSKDQNSKYVTSRHGFESSQKLLFVIKNMYTFISLPNNILYWYVMILSSWKSACFLLVFLCFQHLFKLPHALVWHKMKRNWFSVQLMNEKVAKTCVHRSTRTGKLYIPSNILF